MTDKILVHDRPTIVQQAYRPLDEAKAHLIETMEDVHDFHDWLGNHDEIGFDCETTGLDKDKDRVRLVQIGDEMHGWAIPFERWGGIVENVVNRFTGEYVMHNMTYDRSMIAHEGIHIPIDKIHDTRLMLHVLSSTGSLALKNAAQRYVDPRAGAAQQLLNDGIGTHGGWTWATVPITYEPYWIYGALDPVLTVRLKNAIWPTVKAEAPKSYELERAVSWICEKMSRKGTRIDKEYTQQFHDELLEYKQLVEEWCKEYYHLSPGSNDSVAAALVNAGVPLVHKSLKTGKYSVAKEYLQHVNHPLAGAVLGHRQATKIVSTYLHNYIELSERDGRIHPSINTVGGMAKTLFESGGKFGVRTGRMSMDSPNLQNVPVRTKEGARIRNCFISSNNSKWLKADFDQIEMRVLAHLSGDAGLIDAFNSPDDFFVSMARRIFDDSAINKKDERRQPVKNAMYAKAYGAGAEKFAWTADIRTSEGQLDVAAAAAFLAKLDQQYPGIRRLQNQTEAQSRRNAADSGIAYVRSPMTQRKHTADLGKEYALLNYLIQGTAGEILKYKMLEADAAGLGDYMILPVHDEIDFDVPNEDVDDAIHTIKEVMNDKDLLSVPITSTVSVGDKWGEVKDI